LSLEFVREQDPTNAILMMFNRENFDEFLRYQLNKRLDPSDDRPFRDVVKEILRRASDPADFWLNTLAQKVGKYERDQAAAARNQVFVGGCSVSDLGRQIFGLNDDAETQTVKRAFKHDAHRMAFEELPITGDAETTRSTVLETLDIAYLQGSSSLIKLIRFKTPPSARQLRIPSNRRVEGERLPFMSPTWLFVDSDAGLTERPPLAAADYCGEPRWPIEEADEGRWLYTITYYEHLHFFFPGAAGDNTGAEVGDLAGHVRKLNLVLAGHFAAIKFVEFYHFPPIVPLTFYKLASTQTRNLERPQEHVRKSFDPLLSHIRSISDVHSDLRSAVAVWQEVSSTPCQSIGITISDLKDDLMIHLAGAFAGAQRLSSDAAP
jgi:hypothetical protein